MAVSELGEVTGGEGCLTVGDAVQGDIGIGEDLLAIGPGNVEMLFEPLAGLPLLHHARGGRADLVLGLKFDALFFQAAMIDACIAIESGQALVHMLRPGLAPMAEQLRAVPVADLGAKAILRHLAQAQHHMGMGLGFAIGADIPMDIEISDHALIDKLALDEVARQGDALSLGHFAGNGELDFARQLRVLADLGRLDIIPQLFAILPLVRRAIGQHHFAVDDAGLVGKVMVTIEPLIVEPGGGAIGGSRQRRGAGGARDDFDREMVDRHDGVPFTPKAARRHDV